jgi:DNA-binding IclR family transcriptional regulator
MSSVAKVFRILETIVSHQERGLAYSEVVAETHLPKATTHRVLKSLVEMGYVRFNAEAGRYSGDLKLALLGSAVTSHFTLKDYVRPHLRALQAETGHTCNLGVLDGDAGVYLDKLESPEAFRVRLYSDIGKRFPLHCTGMGKILLAGMRPAEAKKLLARRLEVFTPHTMTDPAALARELDRVRRCGYALDREEITRGIVCVAAPIQNREGDTVAAISVAFPAYISRERGLRGEIRVVTRSAAAITAALQGPAATAHGEAKPAVGRMVRRTPQRPVGALADRAGGTSAR